MHKFTQELRRHTHNKQFGVVNANEPYNFDAYVRVCKVYKNCGEYQSVSQCHSPTNLIRSKTCVRDLSGGSGTPGCPQRLVDSCADPNLCPVEVAMSICMLLTFFACTVVTKFL
uniref:Uncharacterized protein n=1 Tax=Romanomermis culicivorax TaxID=13658 RepID=A0A915JN24_ROMCU